MHVKRAHRRSQQAGQVIITFALSFVLMLMGLISLVADISTAYGVAATVHRAAQVAASHGASQVDIACFTGVGCPVGTVRLLPAAKTDCEAAGAKDIATLTASVPPLCTITGASIKADIAVNVKFPVPVPGFGNLVVKASSSAFAQAGTFTP